MISNVMGYNGNANLKKAGIDIEWTVEMAAEYTRCMNDPIYFSEKYIKIVHVDRGLIPIELYDFQRELILSTFHNRYTVACTGRQQGKTTTAVCLILHYILFNEHKRVALLANKGDSAREILDRIKIAYEALPSWLQQGVIEWNKGSVQFENGCIIVAAATSSTAIRGKSVSFLYIDETAFVENWGTFMSAVYPTISSGVTTKTLLTSTPNGLNHFYKICKNAEKTGDEWNGYHSFTVPWWKIPGRDEQWKKDTLAAMDFDMEQFAQEYECEFLGSSGTLIAGWKLKELVSETPILQKDGIHQYKPVVEGHQYAIVADVSRGKGLDYSAFHVVDISKMPYEQVLVYRSNLVTPIDYTSIMHKIGKLYNNAMVLIEINDIGGQVADLLHFDFEYENIIFTENAGRVGKRISGGFGTNIDKGIRTTKSVKSVGCSILKLLIENNQLRIHDYDTIFELSTFSKKGTSYEAEPGRNDDLVMGLVLFAWLSDQAYFRDMTDISTLNNLRDKTEDQLFEDVVPFGFINDGLEESIYEKDAADFWREDKGGKSSDSMWDDTDSISVL